jgi:hypothetical protein
MLIKVTLSERDLLSYQNVTQGKPKTQTLFELFLKSSIGKMNSGKTIGTISLFDH